MCMICCWGMHNIFSVHSIVKASVKLSDLIRSVLLMCISDSGIVDTFVSFSTGTQVPATVEPARVSAQQAWHSNSLQHAAKLTAMRLADSIVWCASVCSLTP